MGKKHHKKPRDTSAPVPETGRFSYDGLQRVIHEKARLGIMASLVAHTKGLSFGDLKELCNLTDGNLNRHLKVLADDQLVDVARQQQGSRPQTHVRLTPKGRQRFAEYIAALEEVVADAAAAQIHQRSQTSTKPRQGFAGA